MAKKLSVESIKKILKSKGFKVSMTILLIAAAAAALGASAYYSYKKDQTKFEAQQKEQMAKEEENRPLPPIDRSKMTVIDISDEQSMGRLNPFNPSQAFNVPQTGLVSENSLVVLPPQGNIEDSEAGAVMGTTISGIMYDSLNPSAIINIEGTEYFVKNNDTVNNYKIVSITPKQVTIKHGKNIYKAGVGELLTEVESNSNIVNIDKKFGGNNQDNISIKVRKK
ncbi:hypothetical protein IJ732_03060 [bacterium]|nr:hypothetical protein [bacterium]